VNPGVVKNEPASEFRDERRCLCRIRRAQ
jgi:hypothetical protein